MTTPTRTISIPVDRQPELTSRLDRLRRRAERLDLPAPVARFGEPYGVPTDRVHPLTGRPILRLFREVEIENPEVVLPGGWRFLGIVTHLPVGNLVLLARGVAADLTEYREAKASTCDHCGTVRRRNETYLVQDEAGRIVRVGSTCLTAYLGEDAFSSLTYFRDVAALDLDEEPTGFRFVPSMELDAFLSVVVMLTRTLGWVSRSAARERDDVAATADVAWGYCFARNAAEIRLLLGLRTRQEIPTPTDEDRDFGTRAAEWAKMIDPGTPSDYLSNLRVACLLGYVTEKTRTMGLAASAPSAYRRHLDRLAAQSVTFADGFLGEVGDKIGGRETAADRRAGHKRLPIFRAKVLRCFARDSYYGVSWIVKLRAESGHALTWFASTDPGCQTGDVVEVRRGAVKAHNVYRGQKETVLTRCRLSRDLVAA